MGVLANIRGLKKLFTYRIEVIDSEGYIVLRCQTRDKNEFEGTVEHLLWSAYNFKAFVDGHLTFQKNNVLGLTFPKK